MDLMRIPDAWLQDILIFHDFATRWRLRRCTRKWFRLAQSIFVNKIAILEGSYAIDPYSHSHTGGSACYEYFESALLNYVRPHSHTIIGRGAIKCGKFTSLIQAGVGCWAEDKEDSEPWHLIFVNVPDWHILLLPYCVSDMRTRTATLELINVQVDQRCLWLEIGPKLAKHSMMAMLPSLAYDLATVVRNEVVRVPYYYCDGFATPAEHRIFRMRVVLDLLPPLDAGRLEMLRTYRIDVEENRREVSGAVFQVREMLENLSLWLPTAWDIRRQLPAGPIDWTKLPNIVAGMAFSPTRRSFNLPSSEINDSSSP